MVSFRTLAAALVAVGLVPVVVSLGSAWADLTAEGTFSTYGCTGHTATTEYRARYMTRVVEGERLNDDNETVATNCFPLFLFWDSPDEADKPGNVKIRLGEPLLLVSVALAAVALALLAMQGDGTRFLAAGVALLAAVAAITGAWSLQSGLTDHAENDRLLELRSGATDIHGIAWREGPFWAWPGAVALLAGGAAGFLRTRRATHEEPWPGAPTPDATAPPAPAAPPPEPATAPPAASPATLRAKEPPHAAEDGRGPRRLACPRCQHRFVGEWGVTPKCPQCGFVRAEKAAPRAA